MTLNNGMTMRVVDKRSLKNFSASEISGKKLSCKATFPLDKAREIAPLAFKAAGPLMP